MRYIVPCSSCRTELRIPVNLGKLTVRCPRCYHSFLFDPDDKASLTGGRYESGSEDNSNPRSWRGFFLFIEELWRKAKEKIFPRRNESLGWQSPKSSHETYQQAMPRYTVTRSFGQRFARNLLLALILIGIARACFFTQERIIFQERNSPPDMEESEPQIPTPSVPDAPQEEERPQYEI